MKKITCYIDNPKESVDDFCVIKEKKEGKLNDLRIRAQFFIYVGDRLILEGIIKTDNKIIINMINGKT